MADYIDLPTPVANVTDTNVNDGSGNPITSTVSGPKRGLDVEVLGGNIIIDNATLDINISASSGDNIAIADFVTPANKLSISALGAAKVDGSAVTQPVSVASLPLPVGAATSANQTTANTSLSSIDTKLTTPLNVQGNVAHAATDSGNPQKIGGKAESTLPTAVTDNQRVDAFFDLSGRQAVFDGWMSYTTQTTNVTAIGETTLIAAPGANISLYIKRITLTTTSTATLTTSLKEGAGGTIKKAYQSTAAYLFGTDSNWKLPANTALVANLSVAVATGVQINIEYMAV